MTTQSARAALTLILLSAASGLSAPILDLSTAMMRSTYKLEGGGSIGTGFVLLVPVDSNARPNEKGVFRRTLITAAHVLEGMPGETATIHLRKLVGAKYVRYPFQFPLRAGTNALWRRHPDADVAALPLGLPDGVDIEALPSTWLLADDGVVEERGMRPGENVYALGFPLGAEANDVGFPILRSGAIASYPLTPFREQKVFLFDFKVFRGNSGGPVFTYANRHHTDDPNKTVDYCYIVGLVSGEKMVTENVTSLYETRQEQHPLSVAVVVNASMITETIYMLYPDLTK